MPKKGSLIGAWLFAFFIFAGITTANAQSLVLNTNHRDHIVKIVYHEHARLYVSASRDNTIRIWTPDSLKIKQVIPVTKGNIEHLVANPGNDTAAVVIRLEDGAFEIFTIDISSGRVLFSIPVQDNPIHLCFSPQGSYLAYSMPQMNSLYIHDTRTGRRMSYLRDVEGIMSYFTFSRSEANIMTYQTSTGELSYYDVRRGNNLSYSAAAPNLSHLTMLGTRYLVGYRANELYVIDAVNGRTIASRSTTFPVISIITDTQTNTISTISRSGSTSRLESFVFNGTALLASEQLDQGIPKDIQTATYHDGILITADSSHIIRRHDRSENSTRTFAAANILAASSAAINTDRFLASTDNGIVSINTIIFSALTSTNSGSPKPAADASADTDDATADTSEEAATEISITDRLRTPRISDSSLSMLATGSFFAWPNASQRDMAVYYWDNTDSAFSNTGIITDSAVREARVFNDELLILTQQGSLILYDTETYQKNFEFNNIDISSAVRTSGAIIAGKSNSSPSSSPLFMINPETMETVPVQDKALIVYEIEYDPQRNLIYTLALVESRGKNSTVLRVHQASSPSRSRVIKKVDDEELSATMFFEHASGRLYTTLGERGIAYWDGSRFNSMDSSSEPLEQIGANQDIVWAITNNGLIEFRETNTGKYLGEMALLHDNSWVLISSEGQFMSSANFDPETSLNIPGIRNPDRNDYERYRIKTQTF